MTGRGRGPPKVYRKPQVTPEVPCSGGEDLAGKRAADGSPVKTFSEKRDPKKSHGLNEESNGEMLEDDTEKAEAEFQPCPKQ
jgi:hypothetical protein